MKESKNLEAALELAAPKLSTEAQTKLWQAIEAKINAPALIASPYSFTFFNVPKKTMVPVMLVLVVLLGAGGTVAASESAKPGDTLFPLDLAIENVRLSLVIKDDTRIQLQSMFAEERFDELKDILEEEQKASVGAVNVTDFIIDEVATFEAKANVFVDVTVVSIEMADQKIVFITKATSTTAIVADIAARFSVSTARVAAVLRVGVEDRISRPSDTLRLSKLGEDRVGVAVSTILDFLEDEDFDDAVRTASLLRLVTKLDEIHGGVEVIDDRVRIDKKANRIEIHNNHNDSRIEIEHGKTRIRVKEQDGEVRADVDDDHSDSSRDALEVEADVYAAVTIVKVEFNDQKTTFETTAKTEADIAAEVATRFGVTVTGVLRVLDIEIEDGSYHSDDGNNDGRQSDDDNRNDSNSDDKSGRVEKFEARVESGIAEVRVVYNGKELEFEATYITKAALVAEVALKTGLTAASLDAALDLEVRD